MDDGEVAEKVLASSIHSIGNHVPFLLNIQDDNTDNKAKPFDPDENVLLLVVSNPPFLIDKDLHVTVVAALTELVTPTTTDISSQENVDCTFSSAASL
eukprot:1569203-Ditylum_brightwellii.AAC.1